MSKVRIICDAADIGPVLVDGVDVAPGCLGYQLVVLPGNAPQLVLDLKLLQGGEVDGDAIVSVPEPTRRALLALGWTPPKTGA